MRHLTCCLCHLLWLMWSSSHFGTSFLTSLIVYLEHCCVKFVAKINDIRGYFAKVWGAIIPLSRGYIIECLSSRKNIFKNMQVGNSALILTSRINISNTDQYVCNWDLIHVPVIKVINIRRRHFNEYKFYFH